MTLFFFLFIILQNNIIMPEINTGKNTSLTLIIVLCIDDILMEIKYHYF